MALGLVLCLLVGLALGLFGGGGSILAVPILTYAVGLPARAAIAGSLLIVGVSSTAALFAHVRSGLVMFRTGLLFGAAAMLGAYLGGRLAHRVPDTVLLFGFAAIMLVAGVAMLHKRAEPAEPREASPSDKASFSILLYGFAIGALAGLIGAGGGFLIVPTLVLLGRVPMKNAIATSLLIISMQSFAGFVGHLEHAMIPWGIAIALALLAAFGSVIGSRLVRHWRPDALRSWFAALVVLVAVSMLTHQLPELAAGSRLYARLFIERWPWWVGGAAIAMVVLGLLLVENKQLGVSAGCGEVCRLPFDARARDSWRPRFLLGIVLGGALASAFAGHAPPLSAGALEHWLVTPVLKLGVLFGAGLMIGAGARLAGGCTSGHAIVGTALGARSSWIATALFILSGFATTRLLLVFGGVN